MRRRARGLAASVFVAAAIALPSTTLATPISYDFTVTATTGPLAGVSSSGSFAFDDSIIPVGGGEVDQLGLLTALSFTWAGTAYDETSANTGFLGFDSFGNLISGCFGTDNIAGTCGVSGLTDQWYVAWFSDSSGGCDPAVNCFNYATPGVNAIDIGTVSLSPPSVPEPATLLLFGTGLAAAGVRRYRQRQK